MDTTVANHRNRGRPASERVSRLGPLGSLSSVLFDQGFAPPDSLPARAFGEALSALAERGLRDLSGIRVGTDLVLVTDVASCVDRFGDRYLKRLFTDHEISCCRGERLAAAAGLAARFAAKEAAIKVLRPHGPSPEWRSIEVRRHRHGWCELRLTANAEQLASSAGINHMALSLCHEGPVALAVVVALCYDARGTHADGWDMEDDPL